tara:strand:+ start:320 stop:886 length:567 start_codon:yes stop_codon:yes gene_type:complete
MKKIFFLFLFLIIYACNKPRTVLICGDHVCINKAEAEQYFEENLTLEVKILDQKKNQEIDLVEVNLQSDESGEKEVIITNKKQTKKKLKILSKAEIKDKKKEVKNKRILRKENKILESIEKDKLKTVKNKKKSQNLISKKKEISNKQYDNSINICSILEKCNIEEISKYLVKQGKDRKFPDITLRQNK